MSFRTLLRCLPIALLLLLGAHTAFADTVTYTFTGDASGSVGSTSFTNSAFTITVTADTSNISEFTLGCVPTACTIFSVEGSTATLSVDGLTTAITSPIGVFDNQTVDVLGLSRITGSGPAGLGMDLLDLTSPVFGTYNLSGSLSAVGPFDMGSLDEFNCSAGCVITSIGNVSMTSASQVTFTDPVNTPEPTSTLLLGTGLLAVVGLCLKAQAKSHS